MKSEMNNMSFSPPDELEGKQLIELASEHYVPRTMPQVLKTRDMIATFVIILLFLTNVPNAIAGGAAGLTFWLVGALLFFVPTVIVTAQLGLIFPYEGSIYNWTHKAFGPSLGFFASLLFWIPGPLLILATADLIISYVQGLNPHWLVEPWQQGLVLMAILFCSAIVAKQRYRTVQGIINFIVFLCLLAVLLIFAAGIFWLLEGHHSATSFSLLSDWSIHWSPWWNPFSANGNFGLFGLITLGYLGANIPLNMAGEMSPGRKVITQHLLIGTGIVIISYLLATWGVLVVTGQQGAYNLFALVTTVNQGLGPIFGDIAAICIIATIFIATVTYNFSYARLLMVASIDQHLPVIVSKLNQNRIPSYALWFQTSIAIVLATVFFLIIPFIMKANAANLVNQVYFTGVAAATVLWAFATLFLFFNLLRLLQQHSRLFVQTRLFSLPVLIISCCLGIITGLVAIVDTFMNSWTPLISNSSWLLLMIGIILSILVLGTISSMITTSEASFERMKQHES